MPEFFDAPIASPDPAPLLPAVRREARRRRRRSAWLSGTATLVLLAGTGIAFGVSSGDGHGSSQTLLTTPNDHSSSGPQAPAATASPGNAENRTAMRELVILRKVDWASAVDPLHCGNLGVFVVQVAYAAHGPHGYAIVLLRCNSGASTWPDGLFVYGLSAGQLELTQTLVQPPNGSRARGAGYLVNGTFDLTGSRLALTAKGYSSDSVPQCCPDQTRTDIWQWTDSGFSRE